jgi:hypothetical protein
VSKRFPENERALAFAVAFAFSGRRGIILTGGAGMRIREYDHPDNDYHRAHEQPEGKVALHVTFLV